MAELDPRIVQFCERLSTLSTGDRARLKRNAGHTLSESRGVMGMFYRILPSNVPWFHQEMYFLVATLYPLADSGGRGNLGGSLVRARTPKYAQGLDRRVEVLVDSNLVQLPFRLRQAICFLRGQGIPVHWGQLLSDLIQWDHPRRFVQLRWVREYFGRE